MNTAKNIPYKSRQACATNKKLLFGRIINEMIVLPFLLLFCRIYGTIKAYSERVLLNRQIGCVLSDNIVLLRKAAFRTVFITDARY